MVSRFLESLLVEQGLSPLTVRNYTHYLGRFTEFLTSKGPLPSPSELSLEHIRAFRLYLSTYTTPQGDNLTKATQNYHSIAIRTFIKWLDKQDIEVISADKIELAKTSSHSLHFLTLEQLEALLAGPNLDDPTIGMRDRAMMEVLFSTGLRVSELVKLNRSAINLKSREFGIVGKGGRSRIVFLSPRAAHFLEQYLSYRQDNWEPVFIRYAKDSVPKKPKGEDMRLTTRSVQRIVEKYRRQAHLPVPITPHGIRHTFATDLLSHGAGLREVQELLGHKNVSTTQIYTHVTNPQLKAVHEAYHAGSAESSDTELG